ncbi:DUF5008 domain-containing protein [Mucilaginibacter sp. UR6-1]|uniref:DUF5008 domain-containing protein n=1 Tax=Mucilaginibacter sp. UR6-1 TaxID=1435643 RepID=UPI001E547833|nr:DUF5008 domain-containing protein [Mucilaginibacter sp. UR6-1]MCC8408090.1 DUF5008 domain-containing protein [Mucilaginibacter sp. UR6-1]
MKRTIYTIILLVAIIGSQGCRKEKVELTDPYADGKDALGINLNRDADPVPAAGSPGTEVTFKVTGLMPYKDKARFMFNGEQAEIVSITDAAIKVKVPEWGSTGITSIVIDDQLVIGPEFKVNGLVNIDPSFRTTAGTNGSVSQVFPLADGRNLVIGSFTNYDNKGIIIPINRIARTSGDGEYDRSFRTGKAANGSLSSIIEISNKYYISGGFSGYNQRTENVSNITALTNTGAIDSVGIKVYKRPTSTSSSNDTLKWFPKFNGGTNNYIDKIYRHQNKILAVGNFRYYVSRTYGKPNYDFTRDSVILDSTEIRQVLRFNLDGSLDKTFRFNTSTNKGNVSANGPVASYMHTEGANNEKLVLFGRFTTFDGKTAGNIVRLNVDGSIDESFQTGVGADNTISSLTYNSITKKYLITGVFRNYNGKPALGMALLNENGTLDETFSVKPFDNYIGFSRQLNDGLIVISGGFKKYNNITRNGFAVLTPTGELARGYNATGPFRGYLNDVVETQSADGKRALLLIGGFYKFDNEDRYNIVRVTIE